MNEKKTKRSTFIEDELTSYNKEAEFSKKLIKKSKDEFKEILIQKKPEEWIDEIENKEKNKSFFSKLFRIMGFR